ncbi:MAG: DegT/DnrJ/EryC1/StrS family aminotransferase [Nanoarchaeota archaeon]|nr:DegT/DnrJ/EryC1/StrS family aminotransferase [Nanoarchaeota archaeon]
MTTAQKSIPVGVPDIDEDEVQEVTRVVRSGWIARGNELEEFEKNLAQYVGVEQVVTVNSGTAALEVDLRALGIENKEVITTTTSCAPTANSILHSGNTPVMVDISPQDYNIDPEQIEKHITKKTGAILPVHLYGRPANMSRILEIAQKHSLPVIEDCAQSLGAKWHQKMTGSFGEVGCFSLNINKIITTGEGGFIATNNAQVAERARIIRNYGREISRSDYCYTLFGYNFKFTNLQAAIGLAQLRKIDRLIQQRRKNAAYLTRSLQGIPELQLPEEKEHEFGVYFSYPLFLKCPGLRDRVKEFLEQRGIEVRTLFRPMCDQPYYKKSWGSPGQSYPNAELVGENGLYVGCYPRLTPEDLEYMAEAIKESLKKIKRE